MPTEHGVTDSRFNRNRKGVSMPLPEGHTVKPDPRHNSQRPKEEPATVAAITATAEDAPKPKPTKKPPSKKKSKSAK